MVCVCACVLEFWPWVLWYLPGKVFKAWVEGVFLQRGKCLLPSRLLSWSYQVKDHFKFSACFFVVVVCVTIQVMGIPLENLAYHYEFTGEFFFSSCYLAMLFFVTGLFLVCYYACRYSIGDSRFIGGCRLDNMHSLLDFFHVSCSTFENNCKVTRFDTCWKGESRWSIRLPYWISGLLLILFFEVFYILRSKMAFTLRASCVTYCHKLKSFPPPPIWLC